MYVPIASVVSWVVLGINAQRGFITKLIKKKKKKTDINIIVIIAAIEPMNRYIVISLLLSVHRKKKHFTPIPCSHGLFVTHSPTPDHPAIIH
ncbi:hypothetical protein FWK35_00037456, partial [Aphis craccivora]